MKRLFFSLSLAASFVVITTGGDSKKHPEPTCPETENVTAVILEPNITHDYKHYLVGLLHFPQVNIPEVLRDKTSGTYLPREIDFVRPQDLPPYDHIPLVGCSELEPVLDKDGRRIRGEFYVLSDSGFGRPDYSLDYALNLHHLRIKKPFSYRHGEHMPPVYTPVTNLKTVVLHDPHGYIHWTNELTGEVLDIQVEYSAPDDWTKGDNDFVFYRTLTGRDFDPEGMAVISETCAMVADEYMPSLFMINPKTGVVLSPFLRIPDIERGNIIIHGKNTDGDKVKIDTGVKDLNLTKRTLTTVADKQHCTLPQVKANNCSVVTPELIDKQGYWEKDADGEKYWRGKYKRIELNEGFVALALMNNGDVAAFFESRIETEGNIEIGIRVYKVYPGDCTKLCPPHIKEFWGFYRPELDNDAVPHIAAVAPIPGNERLVVVLERNGFPMDNEFPLPEMPVDKLCIVDLGLRNPAGVFYRKKCILNLHHISDPYDVDLNGVFVYAQNQVKNEGLIVLDDYCIMIGTDTDYPWTNTMKLPFDIPFYQEVTDGRYVMICFLERVFDAGFLHFDRQRAVLIDQEGPFKNKK